MSLTSVLSARRFKVVSLALLLSGGTVVLANQWLDGAVQKAAADAQAKAAPSGATASVQVLVAANEVPAGAVLKASDLRWQAWPATLPADGYITAGATTLQQMTGSIATQALHAGEPLTAARVSPAGAGGFMAAVVRPGYRAVTINVTASAGVAGFILPGDRVDLVLSRALEQTGTGPRRFVSETVLSDVRVLGMDQRSSDAKKDAVVAQTATLEVTPKGAEIVAVATELGKLSLSLRSLANGEAPAEERVVTRTWDRDAVQAPITPAAAASPARPRARSVAAASYVEVVRGGQSSTQAVQ